MKAIATLIECQVYDPATSSTKTVRFTNVNDPRATTYGGGQEWRPILMKAPAVGLSVFNGDFTGFGQNTIDQFTLAATDKDLDVMAAYMWYGAVVKIYAGELGQTYPLIYTAVGNGLTRVSNDTLSIDLLTQDKLLQDRQVLYLGYAGTGDIEGTTELTGVVKPIVFGDAKFCKPVLIDPVRQIYQVHGYGPVESIYAVFEGGLAVGTGGNPAASLSGTYAAFRDTAVTQGQWIRHNNLGLIKLGSQPTFPITCHVKGDTNGVNGGSALTKVADIVKRLVTMNVSIAVSNASIATLNTNSPYPVDIYSDQQVMLMDLISGLLRSIGAYWFWDSTGTMRFGRVRFGASLFTLSAENDQGAADVISVSQLPVAAPTWSLRFGAEQCHFVHDSSSVPQALIDLSTQITSVDTNNNRVFPAVNTPPAGAVDGDLWPDTSTTPTTLRRYSGATWIATASNTGANIYDNRPATPIVISPVQVITSEGTAAGIAGQGTLATRSDVRLGNTPPLITSAGGAVPLTDANTITANGTAAAIAGQGAFATVSSVGYGSSYLTGFGGLAPLSSVKFGSGTPLVYREDNTTPVTDAVAVTSVGTAAAIAGQGSLATASSAAWSSQISGRPNMLTDIVMAGGEQRINSYYIRDVVNNSYLGDRWPAEANANVTETRTAAAFSGQGPWATLSNPIQTVFYQSQNYFPWPNGDSGAGMTAGNLGWGNDAPSLWPGWSRINMGHTDWIGGGYYQMDRSGNYGAVSIYPYFDYTIDALTVGNACGISLFGYATNGTFYPYVEFWNGGTYISNADILFNSNTGRYERAITIPSGTTFIRLVVCGIYGAINGYQDLTWNRIKFEFNLPTFNVTPWRDNPTLRRATVRLNPGNGRVLDPRIYNTQMLIGVAQIGNLTPSYGTPSGGVVLVSLPAHNRVISGPNGPVTLSYGACSFNVATSTYWTAYVDDPNLTGIGSPSPGVLNSSQVDQLLYPGRYQLASGFSPDNSGVGGSTGGGGGGGGNVPGCVEMNSWLPLGEQAHELKAGDTVVSLDEHRWDTFEYRELTGNHLEPQPCVLITSISGIQLVLSESTPCTLKGGKTVLPAELAGRKLAVLDHGEFLWEEIVSVIPVGVRTVAKLSCTNGTYAAGLEKDRYIFTHNWTDKP